MRGFIVAWLLVAAVVGLTPGTASGGGSWFETDETTYSPGDVATIVGRTGGGALGWIEDGPFYAYLRMDPAAAVTSDRWPNVVDSDVLLGEFAIERVPEVRTVELSLEFTVPDVDMGVYEITYCNNPCTDGIGDLIGGYLFVEAVPLERPAWWPRPPFETALPSWVPAAAVVRDAMLPVGVRLR